MSKEEHNGIYYDPHNEIVCDKLRLKELIEENESKHKTIADLEAKLAECEKESEEYVMSAIERYADLTNRLTQAQKERELDNAFWKQECDSLQKALAEKEKEWQKWINTYFVSQTNQPVLTTTQHLNQAKTDFAIEQLEIVKELCIKDMTICENYFAIEKILDQQIKELKEGK